MNEIGNMKICCKGRAKCKRTNEWVYGLIMLIGANCFVYTEDGRITAVIEKTTCAEYYPYAEIS